MSNTPIDFFCSSCGQSLSAPPELFGQSIACPACNAALTVPCGPNPAQPNPPPAAPQGYRGPSASVASCPTTPRPGVQPARKTAGSPITKNPQKKPLVTVVVAVVAITATCVLFMMFPQLASGMKRITDSAAPSMLTEHGNKERAASVTKSMIGEDLKSPISAVYSDFKIIKAEHPYYQTAITVDAQNGFGAMIRTSFICVFQLGDGDKYSHIPGASIQKFPSRYTMDSLDHPDGLLASILQSQRSVGGWPSSAQSEQPATVDKSEPNEKNAKPPVGPVSPRPVSTPAPSGTNGITGSSTPEQTNGKPSQTTNGSEDSGKPPDTGKNIAAAPPIVDGPPDDIVRTGISHYDPSNPNIPYRRGQSLRSLGTPGIARDTVMYPIKVGDNSPIYFFQDSFGDWQVFTGVGILPLASKRPMGKNVPNVGTTPPEGQKSVPPVGDNGVVKESKSVAELNGDLAVIETKIKSERQRWQQAENTIHRLTDNHHSYLKPGTPQYVQCEQATLVKDEIQKGAPDLNAEKARLEAMIKDLESK